VIVGQKNSEDEIGFWKDKLGIKGIVELPWVSQAQLPLFYCGAEALIVPSLHEGFGLPPLEAMACGTPVVVSRTSSLPEVVGDAGIFFDPYNVEDMGSGLRGVLTDSVLRKESIRQGLRQAALFSWEKTARQTLEVYEEIGA
jgi:glycosyltransferase involved in cell wall biosynthesis